MLSNFAIKPVQNSKRQHVAVVSEESVDRSKRMSLVSSRGSDADELIIVPKKDEEIRESLERSEGENNG